MRRQTNPGITTTSERRARLVALIAERGETATAEILEISRQTLARAVAGLALRRGTAALIAQRLAHLYGEEV